MANIVLDKILSGYNLAKINNNFEKIENIINEILVHKDGYNALSNSLDINGQKLLNVGDIEINGQSILEGLPALIEGYNEVIESIGEYEDNIQNILDNAIGAGTAATLSYTNKQAVFTVDEPVVALSELELPHYYTVGTNSLRLSVNGSVWYRGKDFDELGSVGSPSNSIKLLKTIPSTSSIEIWIDAQNDQSEYVSHITKAASVMEEYSPSSLGNFVSAMDEYKSFNTEEILNNAVSTLNVLSNYNATANNTLTQLQAISTYIAYAKNDVEVSYTHINDLYSLLMELQESGLDLDRLEESADALINAVSSTNTLLPYISAAYSGTADYTSLASAYKNSAYADKNITERNRISTNYMMNGSPAEVSSAIGYEGLNISAMYTSTSELFTSVESLYNDTDIATSQAATYAELAGESYNNITNLATGLENAVEEAQQIIDQASEIQDSINLDLEKSRLYVEGTDEELLAYGIEDVEHSAKVWNLLVQENAEEYAGFDVQNYYTKEEVDNITDGIEDQLPSFIKKNGSTTIEGSLHFETAGHDIIDVDKVPSGDYRDIVFKNSDGTKRIAVTRISNLANGGKEISFAPINNANAFGKSFVVGMDASDNFYVKADNSTVITEDNIEDYLIDALPDQTGQSGKVLGTDGTEASWVSPPSGRNLHEWVWSSLPLTDAGLHLADGAFISFGGVYDKWARDVERIKNAGLCPDSFVTQAEFDASVSAYGSCGKFVVSADGVRLPKVSDILQGTTDLSAVGDLVEAGLPNITGTFGTSIATSATGTMALPSTGDGAFRSLGNGTRPYFTVAGTSTKSDFNWNHDFKASRSSQYYRDDVTKPNPQTIKSLLYICVATSIKTPVEVDIDEIATDLNRKLNNGDNYGVTPKIDSQKIVSGEFVYKPQSIASSVTFTASFKDYSLSNYLPNDGYVYEVIGQAVCITGTSSGNQSLMVMKTDLMNDGIQVARVTTRTNYASDTAGQFSLPVGLGRKISISGNNTTGTYSCSLRGYRRLYKA